ncbi:hypothetical protein [Vibrio crassostreae]|uniref:hypothetical protein n=1 Tax=Vibrio crassostreae TaxID=246167 RepID=UPI001B30A032|nr:hypothetical protein [Vibrio crassostreae]
MQQTYISSIEGYDWFEQEKLDEHSVCPSLSKVVETNDIVVAIDQRFSNRNDVDLSEYAKVFQTAYSEVQGLDLDERKPFLVCLQVGNKTGSRAIGDSIVVVNTTKEEKPENIYRTAVNGIIDLLQNRSRVNKKSIFDEDVHEVIDKMQSSLDGENILPFTFNEQNADILNMLTSDSLKSPSHADSELSESDAQKARIGIKMALKAYDDEMERRYQSKDVLLSERCYDKPKDCIGQEREFYLKFIAYIKDEFNIDVDTIVKMAELGGSNTNK